MSPDHHRTTFGRSVAIALAVAAFGSTAHANPVELPIGSLLQQPHPFRELPRGAVFDVGGVRVSVRGTPTLRVYDLLAFGSDPHEDGAGFIDWAWSAGQYEGTTIEFRPPVTFVTVRAGDFSGDADGPLTLTAYDCNDTRIASGSRPWADGATAPFAWIEVRGQEICRVTYRSGGSYPGSTFIAAIRFDRN